MQEYAAWLTCHKPQQMVGASYIHNMLSLSGQWACRAEALSIPEERSGMPKYDHQRQ